LTLLLIPRKSLFIGFLALFYIDIFVKKMGKYG